MERDGEDLAPGEDAGWLDDLADDDDALDAWEYTFAMVLDTTLEEADDSDPVVAGDLDLEAHGPALVTRLFLSRGDGVQVTELAGALKRDATADLEAEEAGRQWQEWADAHGDPLRLLLCQLERLGAVSVTGDTARLEPLGIRAVRSKLESDHLFVPVLPAPDKMTPNDLVLVWTHGSDDDLEAELASWTDSRGEERAARDLLAELESERADLAWLIADTFGPFSRLPLGRETFPFDFAELKRVSRLEKPDEVFEAMARLDHPDAEAVLTMIGRHAGDKAVAKAARRAAYKASTRRAARR